MKVEITSEETIKPSSPTPTNLKYFKLSLLDQLIPPAYGPLIYFFSSEFNTHDVSIAQNLKKSLSDTLTLFYPLAGKTVNNMIIDCNDNGARYIQAQVDIHMSHFLQKPDGHDVLLFLPSSSESTELSTGFFTLIQVTFFVCGGFAIAILFSHKLVDATTAGTFMKSWAANMAGNFHNKLTVPLYESAALFPPRKILSNQELPGLNVAKQGITYKRLVFDSSNLVSLKVRVSSLKEKTPTRSEAALALLWNSALKAARSNSGSSRPSVLGRAVNIRKRISPPLEVNSVGNIMSVHIARKDESEVDLNGLVGELRKGLDVFDEKFVKKLKTEEGFEAVINYLNEYASEMTREDMEVYVCTSLCNMSLYDVDFGLITLLWLSLPSILFSKSMSSLNKL